MIKKLRAKDKPIFMNVNDIIFNLLSDKSFLIPFSSNEVDVLLDDNSNDIVYAAYENNDICAISCLVFDISEFVNELQGLDIDFTRTAEIGGCMTLPEYRGKGYMHKLNENLIKTATEIGVKHILATAHPENIASNKSLLRLGMRLIKVFDRHGYRRNLYHINI